MTVPPGLNNRRDSKCLSFHASAHITHWDTDIRYSSTEISGGGINFTTLPRPIILSYIPPEGINLE